MWLCTSFGLQSAAETAARCGSLHATLCGNSSAIQAYAAANAFGLNVPASTFTVATMACGIQVSTDYPFFDFSSTLGITGINIQAQACFPAAP